MRTLLFFDLPTITLKDKREYRKFIKVLKTNGFYMIQESVYAKMSIDQAAADSTIKKLKSSVPPNGFVMSLTVTEKQFASMDILLGDFKTDVLTTDERTVVLWEFLLKKLITILM